MKFVVPSDKLVPLLIFLDLALLFINKLENMKTRILLLSVIIIIFTGQLCIAQSNGLEPIGVGETMGEFTLLTYQGDEVSLSDYKGKKNVLLVFPRGKVLDELWCPLCYYQYSELAEWNDKINANKNYDLEILFVLPHAKDSIDLWSKAANKGLQTIEKWKNPVGYDTLTGGAKGWADYVRKFFPETYNYPSGEIDVPITILMDEDKELSKGLRLYTKEWGGTKTWQNMPTVYLLDKDAVVQFKYHSQYTNDRPTAEYIERVIPIVTR